VTNITFIFETFPNAKPKEKKWGDMAYYVTPSEKVGGTRPPCPPPNCAHGGSNAMIVGPFLVSSKKRTFIRL